MNAFTREELVEDRRTGETITGHMLRGVFASIDIALAESGCPLSTEQRAVLRAGLASSQAVTA